jgi:outer membrane protein
MRGFLVLSLILCSSAFGDLLSFGAGGGVWQAKPSGEAEWKKSGVGDRFDVEKNGLDATTNGYVWAYLEHAIPLLPNIRIEDAFFAADGTKNANIDFGGANFNGQTKTELNMDHIDVIAYYVLPIPAIDIRLGLGAELLDGYLTLSSAGQSKKADLSKTLPIAYGGVRFEPLSLPIGFEADLKITAYDKSRISDVRGKIDWTFVDTALKAAVEIGYRARSVLLKDLSGVDGEIDVKITGAFAGVSLRF